MTLINMGRDSCVLKQNDTVATVLLFRLGKQCQYGLDQRQGKQPYAGGLDDIKHLAPDLLNITKTTETVATRLLGASGWRYAFYSVFMPVLVGLIIGGGAGFLTYYLQVQSELETFRIGTEAKVRSLERGSDFNKQVLELQNKEVQNQVELEKRLAALQREIDNVRSASSGRPAPSKTNP